MALGQAQGAAFLDGIGRAVALRRVVGVVAEEIDALPALEIDDAEQPALLDQPRPGRARRHDVVAHDQAWNLNVRHVLGPMFR